MTGKHQRLSQGRPIVGKENESIRYAKKESEKHSFHQSCSDVWQDVKPKLNISLAAPCVVCATSTMGAWRIIGWDKVCKQRIYFFKIFYLRLFIFLSWNAVPISFCFAGVCSAFEIIIFVQVLHIYLIIIIIIIIIRSEATLCIYCCSYSDFVCKCVS